MALSIKEADNIWRTRGTVEYNLKGELFACKIVGILVEGEKAVIQGHEQGKNLPNRYLGEVPLVMLNKGGKND